MATTPSQRIDVDLLHLKDMRDGISHDTDDALKPGISDANGRIFQGLNIGVTSQSGEVDASRRALAYAMGQFLNNGQTHLERAQQVITFLDKVLANYRTADEFAKLDVNRVLEMLAEAVQSMSQQPTDAGVYFE